MFKEFASYAQSGSDEWHAIRKQGIGGSESAALLGVHPYKSLYTMWQEKVNGHKQPSFYEEAAEWGHLLEPIIVDRFTRLNTEYQVIETKKTFQHHDPSLEWMLANVDRMLYHFEKGYGIFEVKTANQYTADKWANGKTPINYYIQTQHYLSVMNLQWAIIGVLIGGQKYEERYIERDEETIQRIHAAGTSFWNDYVLTGIPPEVDGHESTTAFLKDAHRESVPDSHVELGDDCEEMLALRDQYKASIESLEAEVTRCENYVKVRMGEKEKASAGRYTVTWKKNAKARPFLVKESIPKIHLDSNDTPDIY